MNFKNWVSRTARHFGLVVRVWVTQSNFELTDWRAARAIWNRGAWLEGGPSTLGTESQFDAVSWEVASSIANLLARQLDNPLFSNVFF